MNCSVVSRNSWSKTKKVLSLGTANVFLDVEGFNGKVVVPVQLKSIKQEDGKLGKPRSEVKQPTYVDKKGNYKTSYLSVHLTGELAEEIGKLVNRDWLKAQVKRLFKTGKAGDYEFTDGAWKHTGDRDYGSNDPADDDGYLADACAEADSRDAKIAPETPETPEKNAGVDDVLGKNS